MEKDLSYTLVGLFVLVLGGAGIAVVLWLGVGGPREAYDIYYAYMTESVSGLNAKAPVKFRGVEVGHVADIAIAPKDPERVRLTIEVRQGTPIKRDTVAILSAQGLTGIAFVELTGGSRDSPPLTAAPGQEHPVISTGPSVLMRLDTALSTLFTKVDAVSVALTDLLSAENRANFAAMLGDLRQLTGTLAAQRQTLAEALQSASLTLAQTAETSAHLPALVEDVSASARALGRMAGQLGAAGESVQGLAADGRVTLRDISTQTLDALNRLIAELRGLVATYQRVGRRIERSPNVLLFGNRGQPRGPGE